MEDAASAWGGAENALWGCHTADYLWQCPPSYSHHSSCHPCFREGPWKTKLHVLLTRKGGGRGVWLNPKSLIKIDQQKMRLVNVKKCDEKREEARCKYDLWQIGHQVTSLALVPKLITRLCHLNCNQIALYWNTPSDKNTTFKNFSFNAFSHTWQVVMKYVNLATIYFQPRTMPKTLQTMLIFIF